MIDFKGSQCERELILGGVRGSVAYPMSDRQLEEMLKERGVSVDHSTLKRWELYPNALDIGVRSRDNRCG